MHKQLHVNKHLHTIICTMPHSAACSLHVQSASASATQHFRPCAISTRVLTYSTVFSPRAVGVCECKAACPFVWRAACAHAHTASSLQGETTLGERQSWPGIDPSQPLASPEHSKPPPQRAAPSPGGS